MGGNPSISNPVEGAEAGAEVSPFATLEPQPDGATPARLPADADAHTFADRGYGAGGKCGELQIIPPVQREILDLLGADHLADHAPRGLGHSAHILHLDYGLNLAGR